MTMALTARSCGLLGRLSPKRTQHAFRPEVPPVRFDALRYGEHGDCFHGGRDIWLRCAFLGKQI
jgi:hypothetical protein